MTARRIPAVYMRGGTSKGVFFRAGDLPADPVERDLLLLRALGSPDPYGRQLDGMGGATSSTSKVVVLARSERDDADVDYRFGQVAIDRALIDWSGNCGNLTSAVGPFAVAEGWVRAPRDGIAKVRIWQANIGKHIVAHVPVRGGEVLEEGDFVLDGIAFPASEIRIEFLDPGGQDDAEGTSQAMFPTGMPCDVLDVPEVGRVAATLITAGNPTVFVDASSVGLSATAMSAGNDSGAALLQRCESIRAYAAFRMGLAGSPGEATRSRPHTPKIALIAPPADYTASDGRTVRAGDVDLVVRMVSMGRLHHAITGTGAIAAAVAGLIDGTLPHRMRRATTDDLKMRLGHPSGTLVVGASAAFDNGEWRVTSAVMSRSARRLMEGFVCVPST